MGQAVGYSAFFLNFAKLPHKAFSLHLSHLLLRHIHIILYVDNMQIIHLDTLSHPGAAPYAQLTEAQLRNKLHPTEGLFIAESPKVILTALRAGYKASSLLCEEKHIHGDAAPIIARLPQDMPLYTGSRSLLTDLTGYTLTRGVLCAMHRPSLPSPDTIACGAHRLAVLCNVVDATNVGAIFRSAAALGIDGILLSPDTCDALNRRAVRVSMGSVFLLPWTRCDDPIDTLHRLGFTTAATALTDESISIDHPILKQYDKLAILLGSEGYGLPEHIIRKARHVVRIPMSHGVDSLNVAAASALTFWELRRRS